MFTLPVGIMSNGFEPRGYSMGGIISVRGISGIQFSDQTAVNPLADLLGDAQNTAGLNSSEKGYALGGGNSPYNAIHGFRFSDEAAVAVSAVLSVGREIGAGVNSVARGYVLGGGSVPSTEIDGIRFSDEAAINPGATLAVARNRSAGVNSSTHGYALGGVDGAGAASAEIDGIRFSDEASVNPGGALSAVRQAPCGTNSAANGYAMGSTVAGSVSTAIERFQFSTETAAVIGAVLAVARGIQRAAGANNDTHCYAMGGYNGAFLTEIDGLKFSDETQSNPVATLAGEAAEAAGVQSGGYL